MRLSRWAATVASLATLGLVGGALYGDAMGRFSPDYLVIWEDWAHIGLKLGLVAGTVLGACQAIGTRPPPSPGRTAATIALLGLTAAALPGLAFALLSVDSLRLLYAERVLDVRVNGLAKPGRYVVYRGLSHAVVAGVLVGTVVAGAFLWRGRGEPRSSPVRPA